MRLAIPLSCIVAALAACSSSNDSSSDAASTTSSGDTSVESDAAGDTSAVTTTTDVASVDTNVAEVVTTCEDFTGGWKWESTCNTAEVTFYPRSCIAQTGCDIVMSEQSIVIAGKAVRETATFDLEAAGKYVRCSIVIDGDTATQHCESDDSSIVCDATGVRVRIDGASRYCCELSAQDCGEGQRCHIASDPQDTTRVTVCLPAGELEEGDACVRANGVMGADECGVGLGCANFGQPSLTQRICQRLCTVAGDCEEGEGCGLVVEAPAGGYCRQRCTPFGTDCPEGMTCRTNPSLVPLDEDGWHVEQDTTCNVAGALGEGAVCQDGVQCGPGLDCRSRVTESGLVASCRALCDPAHPCGEGMSCLAPSDLPNTLGIGACFPTVP